MNGLFIDAQLCAYVMCAKYRLREIWAQAMQEFVIIAITVLGIIAMDRSWVRARFTNLQSFENALEHVLHGAMGDVLVQFYRDRHRCSLGYLRDLHGWQGQYDKLETNHLSLGPSFFDGSFVSCSCSWKSLSGQVYSLAFSKLFPVAVQRHRATTEQTGSSCVPQ